MALEPSKREDIIKDNDDLQLISNLSFDKKSSTYSEETEIASYITSKFATIEDNLTGYNNLIKIANNYLTTNNEISSSSISALGGSSGSDSGSDSSGESPTSGSSGDDDYGGREPEGDAPDEPNATVVTKGGRLKVRSGPGSNNKVVAKLKNKTRIVVLEKGEKWSKIAYTGSDGKQKYGYVSNDYLKIDKGAEIDETPTSETPTTPSTPTGSTSQTPTYTSGKVKTSGGRLNVRSGPGSSNKVIYKLKNGAKVAIVKKGKTWTKIVAVDKNGNIIKDENGNPIYGYVASKYIKS